VAVASILRNLAFDPGNYTALLDEPRVVPLMIRGIAAPNTTRRLQHYRASDCVYVFARLWGEKLTVVKKKPPFRA
jgi:hypothetical protein